MPCLPHGLPGPGLSAALHPPGSILLSHPHHHHLRPPPTCRRPPTLTSRRWCCTAVPTAAWRPPTSAAARVRLRPRCALWASLCLMRRAQRASLRALLGRRARRRSRRRRRSTGGEPVNRSDRPYTCQISETNVGARAKGKPRHARWAAAPETERAKSGLMLHELYPLLPTIAHPTHISIPHQSTRSHLIFPTGAPPPQGPPLLLLVPSAPAPVPPTRLAPLNAR